MHDVDTWRSDARAVQRARTTEAPSVAHEDRTNIGRRFSGRNWPLKHYARSSSSDHLVAYRPGMGWPGSCSRPHRSGHHLRQPPWVPFWRRPGPTAPHGYCSC